MTCKKCNFECKTCLHSSSLCTECSEYVDKRYFDKTTLKCVNKCPTKTYLESGKNNQCIACHESCFECTEFTCIRCDQNHSLQ